ncbi:MAG: 3-oxoacyl-ACP reductase FabG [Kiritimatiellae bacterium]|nr:3-oxoacyl-ACP reductase FabG [Kiritimatiellia bacterium]MDW8458747.1 3-oxoacyl-ACP reductase FabG [Verrucomicrobiota bacterium]
MSSLKGRTAVVTGATRGIGKGIARVLASKGANVGLIGRSVAEGTAVAEEICAAGGRAIFVRADVTKQDDLEMAATEIAAQYGGIDILCANAGVFPACKLDDMTEADWDSVFDVNLKGMFFSVKACLPWLKKSPSGRVILTSSITGPITGYPGWSHYGATKSGMLGFMRTAAIELAKYGITVNAVLPGNILTEGLQNIGPEYLSAMTASIPLKRLGRVEEIGYAAAFFASDEAAYINGQALVVDGGQVLPESLQALESA